MKQVYTVGQVAKLAGVNEATVRQHIVRGRLIAEKDGGRTLITQAALDAYLTEDALVETAAEVRKPGANVPREIGNMLARLPAHVAEAILAGIPTAKKAGSPDAFNMAIEQLPKREVPEEEGDPHAGYPIGHQHLEPPRWKRVSDSTWRLDDAAFTWSGSQWVGTRDGAFLGEGISPSSPWSDRRPLAPAKKVAK
jgi:excisionase family DNA binding protein